MLPSTIWSLLSLEQNPLEDTHPNEFPITSNEQPYFSICVLLYLHHVTMLFIFPICSTLGPYFHMSYIYIYICIIYICRIYMYICRYIYIYIYGFSMCFPKTTPMIHWFDPPRVLPVNFRKVLHLYETFGWWRSPELRAVHAVPRRCTWIHRVIIIR